MKGCNNAWQPFLIEHSHGWQHPKFPSITLSKASHCLRWLAFLLQSVVMPGVAQVSDAPGRPCDVKENLIPQTIPPSSIAPCSSFDTHVPIGDGW